jgi:hypothetical protein
MVFPPSNISGMTGLVAKGASDEVMDFLFESKPGVPRDAR